jgi:hypothetical protein
MASAVVTEPEIDIAQFYAESLIDFYISEYYTPGYPPHEYSSEDPNDSKPASI